MRELAKSLSNPEHPSDVNPKAELYARMFLRKSLARASMPGNKSCNSMGTGVICGNLTLPFEQHIRPPPISPGNKNASQNGQFRSIAGRRCFLGTISPTKSSSEYSPLKVDTRLIRLCHWDFRMERRCSKDGVSLASAFVKNTASALT